jgi:ADP-ribosyl-[dinitrogen reductase] hydrolase
MKGEPMNPSHPISIQLSTDNPLLDASAPSSRVLEVHLVAPKKAVPGERHPLNLALVLDRSGSMHGSKLEYVKLAAAHVLDLLGPSDRVALTAYDNEITCISESTLLSPEIRQDLKRRIHELRAGGSTYLSGGWLEGCKQVAEHLNEQSGQVDRTLLLTDGQANEGIQDVEELAVHARALYQRGVSTSTFGVGQGFHEQLLEVMANSGGGNFTYIVSPLDIPDVFAREFGELMDITARDVEIELIPPQDMRVNLLGSWRSETTGSQTVRVLLGSLCAGQEKHIFFDLELPPGAEDQQIVLGVKVRGRAESGEIIESRAELTFTHANPEAVLAHLADQDLLARAALARVSHVSSKSLEMERKGQAAPAAAMLKKAIQENRSHLDEASLSAYQQTAQRMQEGMDEGERKRSHYQAYLHSKQRSDVQFQSRTGSGEGASSALLRQLLHEGAVRSHEQPALWEVPPARTASLTFDKVEGMLLGVAIGDALGSTTEGQLPDERRAAHGEIMDYLPNRHAGGQAVGLPSDDTQLAFWTVEVLLQEGYLHPDTLARRYARERIYGIGGTVRDFLRAYKDQHRSWKQAGQESAGNGAVMRIAPVLLPHLRRPSPGLWADAVLAGMLTHNDYASNAACAALAGMLWELLNSSTPPAPEWWGETFFRYAAPLEGDTAYTARMPGLQYRGSIASFVRREMARALQEDWSVLQASSTWGSGAYLLETLPTALYILARHAADSEQAIIRAVNDTKDNDTLAAIVGAAVGALHGRSALPERWVKGLLGRTNDRNDGHIFQLIAEVQRTFWD